MNEFFKKPVVKILMLKGEKGDKGETGTGTPTGGKTGQYLLKKSDADYDYVWSPITTVSWDNVSGKTNATTSASGLMSAYDKAKLDNLQVGGRNLIANGKNEISLNYPASNYAELFRFDNVSLPPYETKFVMSFDAKSTVDGDIISSYFFNPSNTIKAESSSGDVNYRIDGRTDTTLSSVWTHYWVKYTAPQENTRSVVFARLTAGGGTGTVSIRNAKLETGTVPTDWAPAPEDVENEIKALNSDTKSFTLSAASWVLYDGWYRYVIEDTLVTLTSNQEVVPSYSITREQLKALQKANLVGTQENGKMYLWVYGAVPTIDIPIQVIFRGTI